MKNFKLILALAAITPVLTFGATTVDLTADGGSIVTAVKVGDVTVSNDATDLNITYKIDAALAYDKDALNAANDGKWCIDETHTAVGATVDDIPHNKPGLPVIGSFSSNEVYDCVDTAERSLPIPDGVTVGNDVIIAAHAVVKQFSYGPIGEADLSDLFPRTVTQEVIANHGAYSYFDINITEDPELLDGTRQGWCICAKNPIHLNDKHVSTARLIGDIENASCVQFPQHLPKVEYILNHYEYLQPIVIDGKTEHITTCDLQNAIWESMDDQYYKLSSDNLCGGHSVPGTVASIVADAEAYSANFVPGCDDRMLITLTPEEEGVQATVITYPVPCEGTWGEETAWGGVWGDVDSETRFKSNNWSMWFPYTIEP